LGTDASGAGALTGAGASDGDGSRTIVNVFGIFEVSGVYLDNLDKVSIKFPITIPS
jgi:hypothetical protein